MQQEKVLVWFRRDLRDSDHAALGAALSSGAAVYCAFVFDTEILDTLPSKQDRRVHFIHESLLELDAALRRRGGGCLVVHGRASEEIPALARSLRVTRVYANRDYEPAAKARDALVQSRLAELGIGFILTKDQSIFDGSEIMSQAGNPYSVFTPYKNAWLKRLTAVDVATVPCNGRFAPIPAQQIPELADLGFEKTKIVELGIRPGMSGARALWEDFRGERMAQYGARRDFPALKGVSYLSVHLRFGTISVRELARAALASGADPWLNELIWRDFYFMILNHFPQVATRSFKPAYEAIRWSVWPDGFAAWCQGRTGYPLVDAAMRQLNHCGWMHNRLRMITASFLCKDLGIDWRLGERYFAEQLIDFDLSANNGGWQWAASSGCDAQPYFRIFNPVSQSEKFDGEGRFIRRYVPELSRVAAKHIHAPWRMNPQEEALAGILIGRDYPAPIVDHAQARLETLARYAIVRSSV